MFKFLNIFRRKNKTPHVGIVERVRKQAAYASLDESFNMDGSRIKNPYEPTVYGPWLNYPTSARDDHSFYKKSSSSRDDDSPQEPYDSKRDDDRGWSDSYDNINYQD